MSPEAWRLLAPHWLDSNLLDSVGFAVCEFASRMMPAAGLTVGAATMSVGESWLLAARLLTARCLLRCDAEALCGLDLECRPRATPFRRLLAFDVLSTNAGLKRAVRASR